MLLLMLLLSLPLLLLLIIWTMLPNFGRRHSCLEFARWPYAHRGLWDMEQRIPENSLPAFQRAVEHNYGIELDVHLTADGRLVVFHDHTLLRMCRMKKIIEKMTYEELEQLTLLDTDCRIPLLSEVLSLVNGQVPLLIEMKLSGMNLALCPALAELLSDYKGEYMVESFQPFGLRWFRKHRPEVIRGQLSDRYDASEPAALPLKILSTQLLLNCVSRPDFIAYNYNHYGSLGSILNARVFKTPFWVWTVRNEQAYHRCSCRFTGIIFEKMLPDQHKER
ncbi:MAG: glycerophosphodiester phosphodiesterase [Lachnospiraceae bacterium]|nr:glycerophosphodiester phosphodiesterase [Lachnospiraceae bacterium]